MSVRSTLAWPERPRYPGTTSTCPGIGGIGLPGSGTTAGIGVPAAISPSGSARDHRNGAGFPLRRPNGAAWKPIVLSAVTDTASGVPGSKTS